MFIFPVGSRRADDVSAQNLIKVQGAVLDWCNELLWGIAKYNSGVDSPNEALQTCHKVTTTLIYIYVGLDVDQCGCLINLYLLSDDILFKEQLQNKSSSIAACNCNTLVCFSEIPTLLTLRVWLSYKNTFSLIPYSSRHCDKAKTGHRHTEAL